MGMYSATFAAGMVVLQTTVMLLRRSNTQWSFLAVQRQPVWPASPDNISAAFLHPPPRPPFNAVVLPMLAPARTDSQLAECLRAAWASGSPAADVCWQWTHPPQQAVAVLSAWNPHLIVLALCCVHLVMCVGPRYSNDDPDAAAAPGDGEAPPPPTAPPPPSSWGLTARMLPKVRLPGIIAVLAIITLVVAIVCSLGALDQLRYPTILVVIALFLCASWYAFVVRRRGVGTHAWAIACHLQFVGVPLAVTMMAAMGVRQWPDILAHTILLSAAVNTLWLQNNLGTSSAAQYARMLTVLLPVHCAVVLTKQWSTEQWQQVATVMGCAALLPLFLLTVVHGAGGWSSVDGGGKDWLKAEQKASHLCIAAALLASIANLSML